MKKNDEILVGTETAVKRPRTTDSQVQTEHFPETLCRSETAKRAAIAAHYNATQSLKPQFFYESSTITSLRQLDVPKRPVSDYNDSHFMVGSSETPGPSQIVDQIIEEVLHHQGISIRKP